MTVLDGVLIALAGSLTINFVLWRSKLEVEEILSKIVTVLVAEGHPMFFQQKVDDGETASSKD
jgi:hypothetical protein